MAPMKRKQPARNASPTPSKASSTKSKRAKAAMEGFFAMKNASEASTAPPTESKAPSFASMEPFHGGQKGARDSDATSQRQVTPFPEVWDLSEAGDDGASSQTLSSFKAMRILLPVRMVDLCETPSKAARLS